MMNKMVVANLVHRPIRSLISIVAVALEVALILLIAGLAYGIMNDTKGRQAGVGADVIVQPPGATNLAAIGGAPVSIKVADILRKLPHVSVVSPVIWQLSTAGALEVIDGIDLPTFEALGGPFQYVQGGPFQKSNEMLVDDYIARQKHVTVGDTMEVLNHEFRVAGVVENGRGARKFLPLASLQELLVAKDKASVFYLKLDDPANTDAVVNEIKSQPGMEKYSVQSTEEYLSMMTPSHLPGFKPFIAVVIGVSVIIGFLVIFQSMYAAVMERTREIGILKAMGASKGYIINAILRETGLLAILGILLGIGFSFAASWAIRHRFPLVQVVVTSDWVLRSMLVAVLGALAGALYPAFKAAGKDPIEALAYE